MKWKIVLILLAALLLSACGGQGADASASGSASVSSGTTSGASTDPSPTEDDTEQDEQTKVGDETEQEEAENTGYDLTLAFTGDINLDESWSVMAYALQQPNGIFDCIAPELIQAMQDAALCCVNNEFSISAQGTPLSGKAWTFRASPTNVYLLQEMGVDLVTLANNHVYDYGADAFADTLTVLHAAGIDYVGAGMDLEEAATPVYYELDGLTVAVVNATRAEKTVMTPEATESSGGVLYCYDTTLFESVIAEAKANADFVVCCVHWGTEYSYTLEEAQTSSARTYIDAGADVIVGTHSHCLQGIEFYNGKPIFYSLGNFWFNEKTLETALLELHLTGDGDGEPELTCTLLPAIQEDCVTRYAESDEDRQAVFGLLNEISVNAQVDENGLVTQIED